MDVCKKKAEVDPSATTLSRVHVTPFGDTFALDQRTSAFTGVVWVHSRIVMKKDRVKSCNK